MFKSSTLLKVVSILLIIFGVLGGVLTAIGYALMGSLETMPEMTEALIDKMRAAYSPQNLAFAAVGAILCVLTGILGLVGKSMKAAVISMVIYILLMIARLALSIPENGFSFLSIFSFLLPVLYLWGLYRSQE